MKKKLPKHPDLYVKHLAFTVPPHVFKKIDRVAYKRSRFIATILDSVPESWITAYNKNPLTFKPQF
jgi:hypothetical protein